MTPRISAVRMSGAEHGADLPLLVLGPSLGTSATTLWGACARRLGDSFDVLAWDLPGHGHNTTVSDEPFTMAELAAAVLAVVDEVLVERGAPGGSFSYAGDSVGGAVGLQLLLDAPDRVQRRGTALHRSPDRRRGRVGGPDRAGGRRPARRVWCRPQRSAGSGPASWTGTPRRPARCCTPCATPATLGYVQVCRALQDFDVRDRLSEIDAPVLAVGGTHDVVAPVALLAAIADGVRGGELVELEGVAHLAPAEAPAAVADLIREHCLEGAR